MKHSELIQRIHKYRDALRTGDPDRQLTNPDDDLKLLDDILEALKPVEDAEVRDWIDYKYAKANSYKCLGDALDIIERLAREKAEFRDECKRLNSEAAHERQAKQSKQKRIEELEHELDKTIAKDAVFVAKLQARIAELKLKWIADSRADKAKIEELEEQVQREKSYQKEWANQSREQQRRIAELTGAWKDSIDGVERIAFDMEPPNKHTPRFIMWVNQMRNELNRIKAGR